jgi:hypothetical protein
MGLLFKVLTSHTKVFFLFVCAKLKASGYEINIVVCYVYGSAKVCLLKASLCFVAYTTLLI